MKTLPTLYELQFIDAAFFPCPEQKIARFTTKLIEAYQSSATLLEESKTASGPNKETLYKAARILDQDFSKYVKEKGLVLTWMTANRHPDSERLAAVLLKVFEHLLFLKQLHNKNFTIKAATQSS